MKGEFIDNMLESLQTKLGADEKEGIIRMLGSYFVAGIGLICCMILLGALTILSKRFPAVQKILNSIKAKLFFNSLIRFFIQSYLKFCEIGCFALATLSFETFSEIGSSIAGVLILSFVVIFPLTVGVLLRNNRLKLENEDIKARYGSAYLNVDSHN